MEGRLELDAVLRHCRWVDAEVRSALQCSGCVNGSSAIQLGDRQPYLGLSHLIAIRVGELAVPLLQHGLHRALPGPEGALHDIAGNIVFQLRPHKGSAFAGLHVEKLCKKHSRIY